MSGLLKKIINKIKSNPVYLYIFVYFILLLLLSLFRDARTDETYYLKETSLIAELLRNGIWIGDYGVGLHGFLFKLPVAIAFIILGGPSVFVATLFTILTSIVSLILFYKIVKEYFLKDKYAFWAIVLLSVVLYFINTSLSFNRDIPAVFTVLLFLYFFLKNKNGWLVGISFLLMLDAKEHVFLTVAPLYALYLFLNEINHFKKGKIWEGIKSIIVGCFRGYILPLIWIILMFTTSIVPMNMFVASIFGMTDVGLEWNRSQFSTEVASQNLMDGIGKEIPKILDSQSKVIVPCKTDIGTQNTGHQEGSLSCIVFKKIDVIGGYIGKILYPRTFSFISIPKIIVLPVIIYSISLFLNWFKKRDRKYILPMILLFNVLVLLLRASHGRYLLCVAPIFILFFVMFIRDGLKKPKYFRNVLIVTTIFVFLGLLFESTYIGPKIILESSLLILLWAIWVFRNKEKKILYLIKCLFFSVLSIGMLFTVLAFSYEIGQISGYLNYGYNRETSKIIEELDETEKVWINDYGSGELINVYRGNLFNEPEWHWELMNWIPKKTLLKTYSQKNTFTSDIVDMETFREEIMRNNIKQVALVVSTLENDVFPNEDKLIELLTQDWLKYESRMELKNKIMYIFKVEN